MPKNKPRRSEELKIEAVRALLNRGDRTVEDVAKSLGVSTAQLYRWRDRYQRAVENPAQHAIETAEQAEIRRLRKENEQLRMEREILKKATAFFAKESR
jgi:transposase